LIDHEPCQYSKDKVFWFHVQTLKVIMDDDFRETPLLKASFTNEMFWLTHKDVRKEMFVLRPEIDRNTKLVVHDDVGDGLSCVYWLLQL